MNQRLRRQRDGKNNLGIVTVQTGGHVAQHRANEDAEVKVPQKATGDVKDEKLKGLAKASPFFKKVKEAVKPVTKKEEQKIIAKATVKKNDKQEEEKDKE